jgi:hypothetical protein
VLVRPDGRYRAVRWLAWVAPILAGILLVGLYFALLRSW